MKIQFVAPINPLGYGTAGIGYASGLQAINQDFDYIPIGQPVDAPSNLTDKIVKERTKDNAFIFWHQNALEEYYIPGIKQVSLSTFERDVLTEQEVKTLSKFDIVCSASTWNADTLKRYLPGKQVEVIPHAFFIDEVEREETLSRSNKLFKAQRVKYWSSLLDIDLSNNTLILSSVAKFEKRKGCHLLLDTLVELGNNSVNIVLVAWWYNPFLRDGMSYGELHSRVFEPILSKTNIKVYKYKTAYLLLMPPAPTKANIYALVGATDSFISPSFSEGWNLPLFEAMSLGITCCARIDHSHKDFCNPSNVVPIESSGEEAMKDGVFFNGLGSWKTSSVKDVILSISSLKTLLNTNKEVELVKCALETTKQMTWKKSAMKIQELMTSL